MNDKSMYKRANMSTVSGTPRPTINWLPLLSLWGKELVNEENAKWRLKTIFNVHKSKAFIIFY